MQQHLAQRQQAQMHTIKDEMQILQSVAREQQREHTQQKRRFENECERVSCVWLWVVAYGTVDVRTCVHVLRHVHLLRVIDRT